MVSDRLGLPGLSGVVEVAHALRLPNLRQSCGGRIGDGRFMCTGCGARTSVTAGTIFDRTRTPLTVWFAACWHFATGKDGISALSSNSKFKVQV